MIRALTILLAFTFLFTPIGTAASVPNDDVLYDCSKVVSKRDLYFAHMALRDHYVDMRDQMRDQSIWSSAHVQSMLSDDLLRGESQLSDDARDKLAGYGESLPAAFEAKLAELSTLAKEAEIFMEEHEGWMRDAKSLTGISLSSVRRKCEKAVDVGNMNGFLVSVLVPYMVFLEKNGLLVVEDEEDEPEPGPTTKEVIDLIR